jgi:hypothetical protein
MEFVIVITEHREDRTYIRQIMPGSATQSEIQTAIEALTAARVLGPWDSSYFDYEKYPVSL